MMFLSFGYAGLFLGSFISSTLIPFPSEALLLGAYNMELGIVPCLVIATIGNFLGSLTNYYIGYKGRSEKLVRKFKLNTAKLALWEKRFATWGIFLGLLAWVPFIGDPMVVALGFFKVKFWPLALMILLGKFIRYLMLTLIYLQVFG